MRRPRGAAVPQGVGPPGVYRVRGGLHGQVEPQAPLPGGPIRHRVEVDLRAQVLPPRQQADHSGRAPRDEGERLLKTLSTMCEP